MFLAAVIAAATVGLGGPAGPPDGTYSYSITQSGSAIGTSTVTIKHSSDGVSIHETESRGDFSFVVDETLDPNTLDPKTYVANYFKGDAKQGARAVFDQSGATVTRDGIAGNAFFGLPSGVRNSYVLESSLLTGLIMLPAQIHASRATQFAQLVPSEMQQYTGRISPTPEASRPSGVPSGDAGLNVGSVVSLDEWYDPSTYVLDAVNVPIQDVLIKRTK